MPRPSSSPFRGRRRIRTAQRCLAVAPRSGIRPSAATRSVASRSPSSSRGTLPFELDEFQRQANEALEADRNVLVAAPTGAGKTIVADFAIYLAQQRNVKAFYTTPIKALSNQKYHDLVAVYGADRVGLLTGDTSINSRRTLW